MYYKNITDGHITCIGTGTGDIEITQDEYESILAVIQSRPIPDVGFDYKLRENLTWEQVDAPVIEDEEISDEEAMNIMLGVEE